MAVVWLFSDAAAEAFTVDDYFKIKQITELALSSDGEMIAYSVEFQSLKANKTRRQVLISTTSPSAEPTLIEELQDARKLAWIPGKHELAFLSTREAVSQVFSYDLASKAIRQRTTSDNPVVSFRFALDGESLAFISQDRSTAPSLYQQLQTGTQGILIDPTTTSVYHFVDPNQPNNAIRPARKLWLALAKKSPEQLTIPGSPKEAYWSYDGQRLSVVYVAEDVPNKRSFDRLTSLGVYTIANGRFREIADARMPSQNISAMYFANGNWISRKDKLFARRVVERDLWARRADWAFIDVSYTDSPERNQASWSEVDFSFSDEFIPQNGLQVYVNKTVGGVHSLYEITPSGIERAEILNSVKGSISQFRFSADFQQAAFVNESLTSPPEIHIWRKDQGVRQLSHLNEELAAQTLPEATEISWKSKDGVTVHGWLLKPPNTARDDKPWPLITFVHGGPGHPMTDEFAAHFEYWPYPFMSYAVNGMAVFIPNYRGTKSYGRKFANPTMIDSEPVEDITSGIEYLIRRGIADPSKLAISGHSHGAWLAPLVMTRAKYFRAGSFAEGAGNQVVLYNLMTESLNHNVHDVVYGTSLYADPERYLELSPDLHFQSLETAVLFEAGSRSIAIGMLGYQKAARAADMPTEFFIYPQTDHNPSTPLIQKESAERNLDWFRFWLKDEEDPDRTKEDQYRRWREMRYFQAVP